MSEVALCCKKHVREMSKKGIKRMLRNAPYLEPATSKHYDIGASSRYIEGRIWVRYYDSYIKVKITRNVIKTMLPIIPFEDGPINIEDNLTHEFHVPYNGDLEVLMMLFSKIAIHEAIQYYERSGACA